MNHRTERSWFGRNWKWFMPVLVLGTLALLAVPVALIAGVMGLIRSSDACQGALRRACGSEAVVERLGEPVEPGFLVSGSINVSGPSGHADLAIPVSGPRGAATVYAVADKSAGRWSFSTLVVQFDATGERIDLLGRPPAAPP